MPKIPSHAKCVFKGVLFDVYQWEQMGFDGTTTTFEMLRRKAGVQVLALNGIDVYYLEEEQPLKGKYRGLVGGSAESYEEDPLDVAKRELLEETGMVAKNGFCFLRRIMFLKQIGTFICMWLMGAKRFKSQP
ncbi:MAG: NUDIX hydrolase [Alphaproteobacteria bacterium]|nr:NUDIX hydrolase [Alphaproteobacteria bacterium]MBN2779697.1 NUDIX hydrolase [Alphaproteobacteria bacterium]